MLKQRGRIKRRKKQQMQRLLLSVGIAGGVLIIVLVGLFLYLNSYISKYPENMIAENIYVGPIDAGNMTKAELKKALEEHYEAMKATKVTLIT